jgi:HlyD family secretion protein
MPGLPLPQFEDIDLKNTINTFFSKTSLIPQTIYISILCLLIAISFGMGIFHIPVFIQARGIIRPAIETNQILAPVQGVINEIYLSENQYANKGDSIISFESEKESLQKTLIESELNFLNLCLFDLGALMDTHKEGMLFRSVKYQLDYEQYLENLKEYDLRISLMKTDFQRIQKLYKDKYISEKEFDESTLKYNLLVAEKNKLVFEKKKQWTNELNEFEMRKTSLIKSLSEIDFFLEKSVLAAPVSGIVQGIRSRFIGEFCTLGTTLYRLIPDTGLIAEVYIPPKDIGFILTGQKVRLLIDSYDFRYYGVIEAKCLSISNDIETAENQALFRVLCSIPPETCLRYRDNRVVPGKGMTLNAQFLIAEKSLWQLLTDKTYNMISSKPDK